MSSFNDKMERMHAVVSCEAMEDCQNIHAMLLEHGIPAGDHCLESIVDPETGDYHYRWLEEVR